VTAFDISGDINFDYLLPAR